MDLLECAVCDRRFLVPHAVEGPSRRCPRDDGELRLVVRGLPGKTAEIEAALNAVSLEPADPEAEATP